MDWARGVIHAQNLIRRFCASGFFWQKWGNQKIQMKTKTIAVMGLMLLCATQRGFSLDTVTTTNIAAGYRSSYALMPDSTVKSWGYNGSDGRLGFGSNVNSTNYTPTNVTWAGGTLLSNVVAVAGGENHALALLQNGTIAAWGNNSDGQLGIGSYLNKSNATATLNITNAAQVDGGAQFSLALLSDGSVYSWGVNAYGQLGVGTTTRSNTPVPISTLSNIVRIAAGHSHALALQSDGTLWAWGHNGKGEVGSSQPGFVTTPVPVFTNVAAMAGGEFFTLALTTDQKVWAWGTGLNGRLGNGLTSGSVTNPVMVIDATNTIVETCFSVDVSITTNVTSVIPATKTEDNCLKMSGAFTTTISTNYCTNYYSCTNTAYSMQGRAVGVTAGRDFGMVLDQDKRVWIWGSDSTGQLGIGDTTPNYRTTPVLVRNGQDTDYLNNVAAITAARNENGVDYCTHAMARLTDGSIVGWGDNRQGQLAANPLSLSETNRPTAITIP
jgi:alpha-tubulin suppressor-like RCC1 family protein